MKKLLLSIITLSVTSAATFAQCNELFFSEYAEGTGNNKALEVYNPTNAPIDLSNYWIKRYSNGSTTNASGGEQKLTGTIQPFSTFIIVNGQTVDQGSTSPACDPALQALINAPNNGMLDGVYPATTYMNGNDAITLEKGPVAASAIIVDIFGKIGEDPGTAWTDQSPFTGNNGAWITSNHTLIRKSNIQGGVLTNPPLFDVMASYDSLPVNTWTNLGSHTCDCFVGINEIDNQAKISIFPNPSTLGGNVFLQSNYNVEKVSVYNLSGLLVADKVSTSKSSKNATVNVSDLSKGIYFLKIKHTNSYISVEKLIVD